MAHMRPRFIPACAGEPESAESTENREAVYPRVCGGTIWKSQMPVLKWGLSPRVRGNQVQPKLADLIRRDVDPLKMVVDRRLGEQLGGLSPRVRGNLSRPSGS